LPSLAQEAEQQQQIDQHVRECSHLAREREEARGEATQTAAALTKQDAALASANDTCRKLTTQLAERDTLVTALLRESAKLRKELQAVKVEVASAAADSFAKSKELEARLEAFIAAEEQTEAAAARSNSRYDVTTDGEVKGMATKTTYTLLICNSMASCTLVVAATDVLLQTYHLWLVSICTAGNEHVQLSAASAASSGSETDTTQTTAIKSGQHHVDVA
jgi:septal ring factor EnvC (AmiA/AmiB activator)